MQLQAHRVFARSCSQISRSMPALQEPAPARLGIIKTRGVDSKRHNRVPQMPASYTNEGARSWPIYLSPSRTDMYLGSDDSFSSPCLEVRVSHVQSFHLQRQVRKPVNVASSLLPSFHHEFTCYDAALGDVLTGLLFSSCINEIGELRKQPEMKSAIAKKETS